MDCAPTHIYDGQIQERQRATDKRPYDEEVYYGKTDIIKE